MDIAGIMKTFGGKAKKIHILACPMEGGRMRLTLMAEPASGAKASAFVPLQADGTPEEVDADLDKALPEYFAKAVKSQTNLDQIERQIKSIEERAEADRKAKLERKSTAKPATAAPAKPQVDLAAKYGGGQTPKPAPEPDLFGAAPQPPEPQAPPATNSGATVDTEGDGQADDDIEDAA